jgi:DNA-binding MarR family transcriptional regulator
MEVLMDNRNFDMLKLENQLCFPLYACSKEIIRRYKPFLDPLDLTYTQYIALMVLWEKKSVTVKALGDCLYLDSGTMTPVLKKLESKGYISRTRSTEDERSVVVSLTEKGEALKEQAMHIPGQLDECVKLTREEAAQLHSLLYKTLGTLN